MCGKNSNRTSPLLPRFIRLRDAPFYLGMDKNRFNHEVRPGLTSIPIGEQGIAFDRLDLDVWADDYKSRNGRPGQATGEKTWDAKKHPASKKEVGFGTSTKRSKVSGLSRLLEQAASTKRKGT